MSTTESTLDILMYNRDVSKIKLILSVSSAIICTVLFVFAYFYYPDGLIMAGVIGALCWIFALGTFLNLQSLNGKISKYTRNG